MIRTQQGEKKVPVAAWCLRMNCFVYGFLILLVVLCLYVLHIYLSSWHNYPYQSGVIRSHSLHRLPQSLEFNIFLATFIDTNESMWDPLSVRKENETFIKRARKPLSLTEQHSKSWGQYLCKVKPRILSTQQNCYKAMLKMARCFFFYSLQNEFVLVLTLNLDVF